MSRAEDLAVWAAAMRGPAEQLAAMTAAIAELTRAWRAYERGA